MTVGKGLKVELFASEKEFPELVNPVQMAFDTQGPAVGGGLEELSALAAEDADGRQAADPRGHQRRRQGRQAHGLRRRSQQPDRLRVLQRRRDRRAGAEPRLPQGHQRRRQATTRRRSSSTASTRPTRTTRSTASRSIRAARSTCRKASSIARRSRSPWGADDAAGRRRRLPVRAADVEVRGLRPVSTSPTRTGTSSTSWGRDIVFDATGGQPFYGPSFSTKKYFPAMETNGRPKPGDRAHPPGRRRGDPVEPPLPRGDAGQRGRAQRDRLPGACSTTSSREDGAGLEVDRGGADRLRRPTRTSARSTPRSAPDGALYFADWHNPIIGHMQHNLRDTSRDRLHGRIYRVTYPGRPLLKPVEIAGRADPAAARPAEGARGPRPLSRQDRAERRATPRRSWRRSRRGSTRLDPKDADVRAPHARGALGAPVAQPRRTRRC